MNNKTKQPLHQLTSTEDFTTVTSINYKEQEPDLLSLTSMSQIDTDEEAELRDLKALYKP